MIVCLSGRGDKDMETALKWFGLGKDSVRPMTVIRKLPHPLHRTHRLKVRLSNELPGFIFSRHLTVLDLSLPGGSRSGGSSD